jgi:hypothetical protein
MMLALAGLTAGCGPDAGSANPPVLWLALNGDELHAKLAAAQPPHY